MLLKSFQNRLILPSINENVLLIGIKSITGHLLEVSDGLQIIFLRILLNVILTKHMMYTDKWISRLVSVSE